ncbi:DUF6461 domain-containing protein [Micromonospora sp. DT4]|uniref:DUF6461 domain-containing protein n=1 Tax=Micromonospora sp. DT4 TaxID=3393438 RepID=UPI003CF823D4
MSTDDRDVLRAGQALSHGALVSANGAFALEHRGGGELALRDREHAVDLWRVPDSADASEVVHRWDEAASQGSAALVRKSSFLSMMSTVTPAELPRAGEEFSEHRAGVGAAPDDAGRLVLVSDGYLLLEDAGGRPLWRSGGVDRRVSAAVVTNDGRLVLVDPDGYQRWSRDRVTDADLAAYQAASGGRMTRGQRLDGTLTSPNGRYHLSHTPAGETVLARSGGGMVWSLQAGAPGVELNLGPDGVLRTGTDSTVLAKWTGRRINPVAYALSALVVGDDGDIVLVSDDGAEVYRSGTAAEEARLDQLEREYGRREREDRAKPSRPRGSGLPTDWFDLLDIDQNYSITLVRGVSAKEALLRLGVDAGRITPMTYADLTLAQGPTGGVSRRVLSVEIDDWVMLVEVDGTDGVDRIASMSRGTQAVVCAENYDGDEFLGWFADGTPSARYEWDSESEALESGGPADAGTNPDAIIPFMRTIGLGRYRDTRDDDHFLPPPVEIACLVADVRPRPEHFAGEHLGFVAV